MRKPKPLTAAILAKRLRCSVRTIRRACLDGKIEAYQAGVTWQIDEASVKGWRPHKGPGRPRKP